MQKCVIDAEMVANWKSRRNEIKWKNGGVGCNRMRLQSSVKSYIPEMATLNCLFLGSIPHRSDDNKKKQKSDSKPPINLIRFDGRVIGLVFVCGGFFVPV